MNLTTIICVSKLRAGANIKPFLFTHNPKSIKFSKKIKPFFYLFVVKQLNEIHN